jgi:FMN phosphatase YigB (HAD superfamily)
MKISIAPHQVPDALDLGPAGIEILSLDCFDTLIWRNTHAPRDVFADLPDVAGNVRQRMWAEGAARSRAELAGRAEVTIAEIYDQLMPGAGPAAVARAIEGELAAEDRHCFAFHPTVELMRKARARGLKVIIVSDTYLDRDQLRNLIAGAAGAEVLGMIDQVFCSSEFGVPKAGGLFTHVLRELGVRPQTILHLGDNEAADCTAPLRLGINAIHLVQFDERTEQRLRLEAAVDQMIHAPGLAQAATLQPHRAQVALAADADAAAHLGYSTMGPVLHAFARWVADEVEVLGKAATGKVRLAFLMRDGYLPQRVFEALAPADAPLVSALEISRFTAQAAAFADEAEVLRYVETELATAGPKVLGRQLLLTPQEVTQIGRGKTPGLEAFLKEIRDPRTLRKIVGRSKAFAAELVAYVRGQTGAQSGDTLVLVDLGYNGTVQNCIAPILERELGVEVIGRYLILNETVMAQGCKRGLIDRRNYDYNLLSALCANVAVLEQLCTAAQGSVVGYGPKGARREAPGIKGRQSEVRDRVQAACIRYAAEHGAGSFTRPGSDGAEAERKTAAAALTRLFFLPMPDEIEALLDFEHDVNLGTQQALQLFDRDVADEGLRRWGVFYMKNARRMYLPAELRGQGLPLSLTFLTQSRFGLNLRYPDFCDRELSLPIMLANGAEVALEEVRLAPTHEGYLLAAIPAGDCRFAVGVQFGRQYEWVQIESVSYIPAADFLSEKSHGSTPPVPAAPLFEAMQEASAGLYRCTDESAFMMIPPTTQFGEMAMVLAVVFRPLTARGKVEAAASASDARAEQVA